MISEETQSKVVVGLVPVLLAAMWWVIASIGNLDKEIYNLRSNQMMLITPDGKIIPSPDVLIGREKLKAEIVEQINDLKVRTSLLEKGIK